MYTLSNDAIEIMKRWEKEWSRRTGGRFAKVPGNIDLLFGYILNRFNGTISEDNLNEAADALYPSLKYQPGYVPPDPKAAEKIRAEAEQAEAAQTKAQLEKEQRRRQAEEKSRWSTMPVSAPNHAHQETPGPTLMERAAAKATEQKQGAAKQATDSLISGYLAMTGPRINHARTAERRKMLSEIRVFTDSSRQTVNWVQTHDLVSEGIKGFKD